MNKMIPIFIVWINVPKIRTIHTSNNPPVKTMYSPNSKRTKTGRVSATLNVQFYVTSIIYIVHYSPILALTQAMRSGTPHDPGIIPPRKKKHTGKLDSLDNILDQFRR